MQFHDVTHTGEITSRMGSDIQELGLLLGNYFGTGVINLVQTLGSLGVHPSSHSHLIVDVVYLSYINRVYSSSALADYGHYLL